MPVTKIPCAIIRGGTSKGVFLHAKDLPEDPVERDKLILSIFGSPDSRQIDGLGGADPLTSKVAIIEPSIVDGIDINYTFGQVAIDTPSINYSLTCGNILSGAAIYAVDEGLVEITEPITKVNIFNTNTRTHITADVIVNDSKSAVVGTYSIDGVPGTGSIIKLSFNNTIGAFTGKLLPTGNPLDILTLASGQALEASIIDAGNLYVIIEAHSLGLNGSESPTDMEGDTSLINLCLEIMGHCSDLVNSTASLKNPIKVQKLAIVSPYIPPPTAGEDTDVLQPSCDFESRIISLNGKVHKSYAVTGAINTASSAYVSGTILNRMIKTVPGKQIDICHPEGIISLYIETSITGDRISPVGASINRTARRIMDGFVYIKPD